MWLTGGSKNLTSKSNRTKKQFVFAPASLILTNYFLPLSEALATMNRPVILSTILFVLSFSPILLLVWWDKVDPPFISNNTYNFLLTKLSPFVAIVLCTIFYFFMYSYSKFGGNNRVRAILKNHFSKQGKKRLTLELIFLPVFVYGWIFTLVFIPIQLWAFYSLNPSWSNNYQLVKVKGCGYEYEKECIRLTLLELDTNNKHTFRWYSDSKQLTNLDNEIVTIIGEEGYFGYMVNTIKW